MSYCTFCGKQISDTAKFCTGCGVSLSHPANSDLSIPSNKILLKKNNYAWLIVAGFVMLVGVASYFLFFNIPKKSKKDIAINNADSTAVNTPVIKTEYPIRARKETTSIQRRIPQPLVPIVRASDILPSWSQNEDIEGEHPLIGFYFGAIGKKPIKLFITGVDTISNSVIGYSIVGNNNVNFEGTFTKRFRKATTNQASNIVDADSWIYNLILFEPDVINTNGVFQLEIGVDDISGSSGGGSWISYNEKLYREISLINTIIASNQ